MKDRAREAILRPYNVCRRANEIVDIAKLVLLSLLMAFYLNTSTRGRVDSTCCVIN